MNVTQKFWEWFFLQQQGADVASQSCDHGLIIHSGSEVTYYSARYTGSSQKKPSQQILPSPPPHKPTEASLCRSEGKPHLSTER